MKKTKRSKIGYYWTTTPRAVGFASTPEEAEQEHAENYALAAKCADGITTPVRVCGVKKEIERTIGQGVFYNFYMVWLCDGSKITKDELNRIIYN